jgi:hypothetical protein
LPNSEWNAAFGERSIPSHRRKDTYIMVSPSRVCAPSRCITRLLTVLVSICGVPSIGATKLAPEYPDEFTYRLSYSISPEPTGKPSLPRISGFGVPSLADDVGTFLTFDTTAPVPAPSGTTPRILGSQIDEEPVTEVWVRFGRQDFATHHATPAPGVRVKAERTVTPSLCAKPLPAAKSPRAAWNNAYQIIAIHGYCPNAALLLDEPDGRTRKLLVVEPRIPTPSTWGEDRFTRTPVELSSRAWPFPHCEDSDQNVEVTSQFWHRGLRCKQDSKTQPFAHFDDALDRLLDKVPSLADADSPRVLIAHLDTGYPNPDDYSDYHLPANFHPEMSFDCYEPLIQHLKVPCVSGVAPNGTPSGGIQYGVDVSLMDPKFNKTSWFLTNYLHGAGTLSILAGPYPDHLELKCARSNYEHLGANPCAGVFEVRIGQSFVHFNEESMAAGIRQAVAENADVISISHGGFPAAVLEKAVDYAYEHGSALFAASGDYLGGIILSTPKTVVFPARYYQVMNVTGADADGLSSGVHCNLLRCVWKFGGGNGFWSNFKDWFIGTNFGPAAIMRNHSVAAYTPNITIYDVENSKHGLSNDEPGTSAAVPQAAAAASMWLEYNRAEILKDGVEHPTQAGKSPAEDSIWRSWRKTEAVYQAMQEKAVYSLPKIPEGISSKDYVAQYFGAGLLDANAMMDRPYRRPADCDRRHRSKADLFWWAHAITSTTVIGMLDLSAAVPPAPLHEIVDAVAEASRTELSQVAYRSSAVAELLASMSAESTPTDPAECSNRAPDLSKIPASQWRELASLVQADWQASKPLKKAVASIARHSPRSPQH